MLVGRERSTSLLISAAGGDIGNDGPVWHDRHDNSDATWIDVRVDCIQSFATTGLCGDERPASGDSVARMYFENENAPSASAAAGGGDLDWGLCNTGDSGDKHHFLIGQQLNIVVAHTSSDGPDDIAGAQGEGGSKAFVNQTNGNNLQVLHAMAAVAVSLFGNDCAFDLTFLDISIE